MRSAAIEVAPSGITINAVLPWQRGDSGDRRPRPGAYGGNGHGDPGGKLGHASDIAWAVRYLASPEAGFVTGHSLVVDGGQLLPESQAAL